jgi:prepilin-type N-terminal cleavage/methylation domain-containing protein
MKAAAASPSRRRGFTLLELTIVLLIVAILASLATASYGGNIVRSRRQAAAVCLHEAAQLMERYYVTHLSYVGATARPVCLSQRTRRVLRDPHGMAADDVPVQHRRPAAGQPGGGRHGVRRPASEPVRFAHDRRHLVHARQMLVSEFAVA